MWSALAGVDRDVAHLLALLDADEVDRAEVAAGVRRSRGRGRRARRGGRRRRTRIVALNDADGRCVDTLLPAEPLVEPVDELRHRLEALA